MFINSIINTIKHSIEKINFYKRTNYSTYKYSSSVQINTNMNKVLKDLSNTTKQVSVNFKEKVSK